jgi:hypothetical protein
MDPSRSWRWRSAPELSPSVHKILGPKNRSRPSRYKDLRNERQNSEQHRTRGRRSRDQSAGANASSGLNLCIIRVSSNWPLGQLAISSSEIPPRTAFARSSAAGVIFCSAMRATTACPSRAQRNPKGGAATGINTHNSEAGSFPTRPPLNILVGNSSTSHK